MKYWKVNADKTVERSYQEYEQPYPDGIIDETMVDPEFHFMDTRTLKYENGQMRYMTEEELSVYYAKVEADRQAAKDDDIKKIENNFFKLCYAIFGTFDKRGFDEINSALEVLKATNFALAVELGLKLSAVNQEGLREIGARWWDDCAWHPEIEG